MTTPKNWQAPCETAWCWRERMTKESWAARRDQFLLFSASLLASALLSFLEVERCDRAPSQSGLT